MSKCQIGKYRPGGRCGGDGAGVKKDAGSLGPAYAALMAARERLDAGVRAPALALALAPAEQAQAQPKTESITLFTQGNKSAQRKADIELILEDYA